MTTEVTLQRGTTVRDILKFLFKRKGILLGLFLLTTALVAAGAYLLPPSYEASSQVLVERTTPNLPELYTPTYHIMELDEIINSEIQIITSRTVAENVVDTLDLHHRAREHNSLDEIFDRIMDRLYSIGLLYPLEPRERSIARIQNDIDVKPVPQSDIIQIAYDAESPEEAAEIVNAVTDAYVVRRQDIYQGARSSDVYKQQMDRAKKELDRSEEQRERIKRTAGITSADEEIRLVLQEIDRLNGSLRSMQVDGQELQAKLAEIQDPTTQALSSFSSDMSERNPLVDEMGMRLLNLRMQLVELSHKSGRGTQEVRQLQEEIASLEKRFKDTVDSMLTNVRSKQRVVKDQIGSLQNKLQHLDSNQADLRDLELAISAQEKTYLLYKDKYEAARFKEVGDRAFLNVKVVDRASVPQKPRFSRLFLLLLGALAGGTLGLGVALLREHFDHSLHDEAEARERLRLPVLATIPRLRGQR